MKHSRQAIPPPRPPSTRLAITKKLMREKGVQIVDIDIKPFIASTSGVYEKLGYTDLRKQVNVVLGK
jgi:hypothetical protein